MPKIGDKVNVQIRGDSRAGTAVSSGSKGFNIDPGAEIQVPGRIVDDYGDSWLIELSVSVSGKNRLLVLKSAYRD